jgi:hypothetical protein
MSIKPSEFMAQYRAMTVPLIDGTSIYNIDVHEYRNAKDYYQKTDDISPDHDVFDGMGAFAKLKNAIIKHGKKIGSFKYRCTLEISSGQLANRTFQEEVNLRKLEMCFAGKGSPLQVQKALRLAQAFGFIRHEQASMSRYVTKYLGIDCSGFVSNYLSVVCGLPFDPAKFNAVSYRTQGTAVASLTDVKACDVMSWATTNHVAIIDNANFHFVRNNKQEIQAFYCLVVESTGSNLTKGNVHTDGLVCTYYLILPPDAQGRFSIARSLGWEQAKGTWSEDQARQKETHLVHIRRIV